MQNQLFADIPESERKRYLSDNCDRLEDLEYLKPFGPEELTEKKDALSTVSIQINDTEEEKKEVTASYNETLKGLNKSRKKLLKDLRQKAELVTEQTYLIFDQEEKLVGYYNDKGQLVSARSMRPGEFQKTVFSVTRGERTGTDD